MTLIESGPGYEIWEAKEHYGSDFYVFGVYHSGDPRVCPSIGMAREVAADIAAAMCAPRA